MTTVLEKATEPFQVGAMSERSMNFLVATENYAMAADELREAAAELRKAIGKLNALAAQCRLSPSDGDTVSED